MNSSIPSQASNTTSKTNKINTTINTPSQTTEPNSVEFGGLQADTTTTTPSTTTSNPTATTTPAVTTQPKVTDEDGWVMETVKP